MAIVYQLVRDHNGEVVVDSETGKGTRISIKLPISGRIAATVPRPLVDEPRAESSAPVAVAS